MREESQLDDMRAAIRGDFERLAERRGEQELMRVTEPELAAEVAPPTPVETVEQVQRRSWLSRFIAP